jgi:iron-sulfur cluster assembly accessory protein
MSTDTTPAESAPSTAPSATAPSATVTLQADQAPVTTLSATTHTAKDGKGIQITEPAMKQLAALMQQQGAGQVLRVGVRSGGCSGMSYTMDFISADGIQGDDERYIYEPAGAPSFEVVCDPKSLLYIYGMQLDFSSALIGGGFNFTNPNATQTCGCGSSFAV